MKKAWILLVLMALSTGCANWFRATPRLAKWHNNEMTLCCAWCSAMDWGASVSHHCQGKAKQIAGETVEKVTGYATRRTQDGPDERIESRPEVQTEECRTYSCDGGIHPDKLAQ